MFEKIAQEAFNDEIVKMAGPVSEVAGTFFNPMALSSAPIGAILAMLTSTKTNAQMKEQDKGGLTNFIVPGLASYRVLKRMGNQYKNNPEKYVKKDK
jgi:uncharacterized membrane protein YebE (DUF533 family)